MSRSERRLRERDILEALLQRRGDLAEPLARIEEALADGDPRGKRPIALQALFIDGAVPIDLIAEALRALGAPEVCEGCGAAAPPEADTCSRCGRGLAPGPGRLTGVDLLSSEKASQIALGRPVADDPRGIARYQVQDELGRGGMGIVLGVRDAVLERDIALKVIRTGMEDGERRAERFLREGRVLAAIEHKGLVRVFDTFRHRDRLCMALERIEGRSLRDLAREGALDLRAACAALADAGEALDAVHRAGIVHRDIKPANIVLDQGTGRAKVIDFGLARDRAASGALTTAGLCVGTPYYLSPEQVEGREDVDGRADVYALGVCLYQVLMGRRPFTGSSQVEILQAILRNDPPRRRDDGRPVPEALLRLALSATSKFRRKRPQSGSQFAEELRAALAAEAGGAPPAGAPVAPAGDRTSPRRARRPVAPIPARRSPLPLIVAGIALATLAVVAVALRSPDEPRDERPDEVTSAPARPAEPSRPARGRSDVDPIPPPRGAPAPPLPTAYRAPEPRSEPEPTPDPLPAPAAQAEEPPPPPVEETVETEPPLAPEAPILTVAPLPDLEGPTWQVRAIGAASLLGGPSADGGHAPAIVAALTRRVSDEEPIVRLLALRALGTRPSDLLRRAGGRRLADALAGIAGSEPDPAIADAADAVRRLLGDAAGDDALPPGAEVDAAQAPAAPDALVAARPAAARVASWSEDGVEVCLVVDVTKSMADELELLKDALPGLHDALERLAGRRGARLGVTTYGKDLLQWAPLTDRGPRIAALAQALTLEVDASNKTIPEAVDKGVAGALHRRIGWRKRADRALVVFGDAPPPGEVLPSLLAQVEEARGSGFRTGALVATPPAGFKKSADPLPPLTALAQRGGGGLLELADGEAPLVKLLAVIVGLDVETARGLVGALQSE